MRCCGGQGCPVFTARYDTVGHDAVGLGLEQADDDDQCTEGQHMRRQWLMSDLCKITAFPQMHILSADECSASATFVTH
jgi:hypothetical protein